MKMLEKQNPSKNWYVVKGNRIEKKILTYIMRFDLVGCQTYVIEGHIDGSMGSSIGRSITRFQEM